MSGILACSIRIRIMAASKPFLTVSTWNARMSKSRAWLTYPDELEGFASNGVGWGGGVIALDSFKEIVRVDMKNARDGREDRPKAYVVDYILSQRTV